MLTDALALAILTALVLYLLFGGADFGGGVWDLLASGPRREAQRELIERAIGPIWEANHVWLILAVVLLFSAFPPAFAALSVAFHVPLTLFLIGIVLRGSSFAFRSFEPARGSAARSRLGLIFSISSVVAPALLGVVVGACASGSVELRGGQVTSGFFASWLAPFPIATGLFALSLCAYLAATYLTREAPPGPLAEDFRARALAASGAVAVLGLTALLLAFSGAPRIAAALTGRPWAWALEGAALAAAVVAMLALVRRRFARARLFVAAEVALIVIGWAAAQYPYLLVDDLTLREAAASARTQRLVLTALLAGIPVLAPSLYLLFRVFKRAT
jgi:cytochrome d ubiquinol oxidase subunit II